jgi:hypothetical protein
MQRAERFRRDQDSAFEIEQAVVSLARAVLAGGAKLVFGGHPTISPLVGVVAGEYRRPPRAEGAGEPIPQPPGIQQDGRKREPGVVVIYQSEAFRGHAKEDTLLLFKLELTEVHWTKAVDGERYDPNAPPPPCPKSVNAMREQMLRNEKPNAMVCVSAAWKVSSRKWSCFEGFARAERYSSSKAPVERHDCSPKRTGKTTSR